MAEVRVGPYILNCRFFPPGPSIALRLKATVEG